MAKLEISELLELPIGERVKLVQALWDSIAEMPDPYPLSERERRLIDERLEAWESLVDGPPLRGGAATAEAQALATSATPAAARLAEAHGNRTHPGR